MIARSVGLGLALVSLWAVSASAQDYERNGFYLGLGGTYTVDNFDVAGWDGVNHHNSWGLNARIGYRFHPNFSVELAGEWLDGFDFPSALVLGGSVTTAWTIGVNGKVHLETGRVQPFLLLGLGMMRAERDAVVDPLATAERMELDTEGLTDLDEVWWLIADALDRGADWDPSWRRRSGDSGFAARFGAGLEIYATEQFVVNLEASYVLPTGNLDGFGYGSFGCGLEYRF